MTRFAPPCGWRSHLQGGLSFTRAGLSPVSLPGRSFVPAGFLARGFNLSGWLPRHSKSSVDGTGYIDYRAPYRTLSRKKCPLLAMWGALYQFLKLSITVRARWPASHARSSRLPSPAAGLTDCRPSSGTPGSRGTDRDGTPSGSTASIRIPSHPLAVCASPAGRVIRAPFRKAWRGSLGIPLLVGRLSLCCIFTAVVSPSGR